MSSAPSSLPNAAPAGAVRLWQNVGAGCAFTLPWVFGLAHAGAAATFEDDAALLAAYRALPLGFERLISSALVHAIGLLPLGAKVLRASATQALCLGLFGLFAYLFLLFGVLRGARTRVSIAAALLAALASTLNPLGALHGATPAGAATAALLALAGFYFAFVSGSGALSDAQRARRALLLGALTAATLLESRWCGLALCAALSVRALPGVARWSRRELIGVGIGAGLALFLAGGLLFGHLTRLSQLGALFRFGLTARAPDPSSVERWVALETWLGEAGLVGLVLAGFGLAALLRSSAERRLALGLLVFLGFDLAVPARARSGWAQDPGGGVRLLAVFALVALSVACARRVLELVERLRVPFARAAASGALAYGLILLLIGVDQTRGGARAREEAATALYTQEALASLPAGAALLLRSQPVWQRILVAQTLSGARTELVLLPMPVIESGASRAEPYAAHAGLLPLIRDMLLAGKPSEYALSALADARPTFVELDSSWEPRLHTHLAPHGFFLAFAPQPLARSERAAEPARARRGLLRLATRLRSARQAEAPVREPVSGSRRVLIDALGRRAALLASLGDLEPAHQDLKLLLEIAPEDRSSLTLKQRLDRAPKGRVETRDLFAAR